jgi:hypothetical protein
MSIALPAVAAPLDALLSAAPLSEATQSTVTVPTLQFELATDRVNNQLDIFKLRNSDPRYAGTRIGDYTGNHLTARVEMDRLRLDGTLWRRALQDRVDVHHFNSWQMAGQLRLNDDALDTQTWALRLGAWGNDASQVVKTTSTRLSVVGLNTLVSTVQLNEPSDQQRQLNLIFSQRWPAQTVSAFIGAGTSQVANEGVTGTSRIGNCPYTLEFGPSTMTATPAGSCSNSAPMVRIPNALLPYSAQTETNYGARYLQAGLSHRWQGQTWGTRLGLVVEHWQRERIDAVIVQRKGHAYTTNATLIGELSANLMPHVTALMRGQFMRNQFVGELPLAYNTLSASRFGSTYGLATFGVSAKF